MFRPSVGVSSEFWFLGFGFLVLSFGVAGLGLRVSVSSFDFRAWGVAVCRLDPNPKQ